MIILVILLLLLLYVLLMKPNNSRKDLTKVYSKQYIAHRGLFDNTNKIPENSKIAFEKAIQNNYGIEFDIQLTKDNELVVFHDFKTDRMLPIQGYISDFTLEELQSCYLLNSSERIMTFKQFLALVDGAVPLIIEFKARKNIELICLKAMELLNNYQGNYCIESFNPLIVYWFKTYRKDIIRGQLSTDYYKDDMNENFLISFICTNCLTNILTKPDFIAYNHLYTSNIPMTILRSFFHPTLVAWTIKNQIELDINSKYYDILIFDSFIPNKKEV